MKKRSRIFSSIAVAAVFLGANPASAQSGTPAYGTTFFYDAALTTWEGNLYWVGCDSNDNGEFMLEGRVTNYSTSYIVGYCENGVMRHL